MHQFIYRHYKTIIFCAAALSALSVFSAFRLKLDLSLFSLLPAEKPEVQLFFQVTEKIGFQSLVIAIVEMNGDPAPEKRREFIDSLAHRYGQSPMIEAVAFKNDNDALLDIFDTLLLYLPHLLTFDDLKTLGRRLSTKQISRKIAENKQILMTPFSIAGKEMILRDPLGIGELLVSSMRVPDIEPARELSQRILPHRRQPLLFFIFNARPAAAGHRFQQKTDAGTQRHRTLRAVGIR